MPPRESFAICPAGPHPIHRRLSAQRQAPQRRAGPRRLAATSRCWHAEDEFDPADRWLLGLQHQGRLGRLRSRIDYTEVSDRDYFRVLGGDGIGVRRINLLRFGELSYAQGGLSMRLWARSFQRLDEIRRPEYSQAPALDIAYRTEGPGPLQLSLDARTASFDRNATGCAASKP